MLLTVSGPPGSGTSTVATALATEFDLRHVSGGDIFRSMAEERELSLEEFGDLAEENEEIDLRLDARLRHIAVEEDDIILESRLAGWMAGNHADLRIWLDAPQHVRAKRIAEREGWTVETAERRTAEREANEGRRYQQYYNIDVTDRSIYDIAINSARWTADAELAFIVAAVTAYDPSTDEGKVPVTDVEYSFE